MRDDYFEYFEDSDSLEADLGSEEIIKLKTRFNILKTDDWQRWSGSDEVTLKREEDLANESEWHVARASTSPEAKIIPSECSCLWSIR